MAALIDDTDDMANHRSIENGVDDVAVVVATLLPGRSRLRSVTGNASAIQSSTGKRQPASG